MLAPAYVEELRTVGTAAGLARVGVARAEVFADTRAVLDERKAAGLHGGMQFTYRNPARSTDPERALAGVRSLVVGAHAYPVDVPAPTGAEAVAGPLGRVARYATGDHYGALRAGLDAVAERLRADGWQARVVLDDNALVDRAAAVRAGLGWFGKNANVLLPGAGSFFVLGSVLTDAPLPADEPVAEGCGACRRCLDGCPTGAIVAPGAVDARRCLAWLVQAEGVFPAEHREALGDRLYGCDTCQEVCPPTVVLGRRRAGTGDRGATVTTPHDVGPGRGGPVAAGAWVPVLDLLGATDEELLARHGRWYIPRRDPTYLRRNALIVLGNAAPVPAAARVVAAVADALAHEHPVVRGHAVWAARRLGLDHLLGALAGDDDPFVRKELARAVPARSASAYGAPGPAGLSGGPR